MRGRALLVAILAVSLPAAGLAQENPRPIFTLAKELGTDVTKAAATAQLGVMTAGVGPVVVASSDFLVAVGEAGVAQQDRTLGAEMVLVEHAGADLAALHAAGIDTRTDRRAIQARLRLKALQTSLLSGEDGAGYVAYAVGRHPTYAFGHAGLGLALNAAFGRVLGKLGLGPDALPFGAWVKRLLGRHSPVRLQLHYAGWRRFGNRSTQAKAITDKLTAALAETALEKAVDAELDSIEDAVRRGAQTPPQPQPVYPRRIDLARAVLPVAAIAQVAPVVAVPIAFDDPRGIRAVVATDPVMRVVQAEDVWIDRPASVPLRTVNPEPRPAPVPPEPEPPSASDRARRHDWDCAGAGVKAGCDWPPGQSGSWDGERGKTLHDR